MLRRHHVVRTRVRRSATSTSVLTAALIACGASTGTPSAALYAQPAPAPVRTSHVLAIGHMTSRWSPEMRATLMPQEVRATVRLYLDGKIAEWFVRQDQPGVVFLMNVSTVPEAKALLDALPLGVAHVMEFDLLPVGPLSPLSLLLDPQLPPNRTDTLPAARGRVP